MAEVYGLSDKDRRKLAEMLGRDRHAARRASGLLTPAELFEEYPREIEWKNNYSDTCPPGGVIKITGYEADAEGTSWRLLGVQPDDEPGLFYAINGLTGVAADGIGQCLIHGHALVGVSSSASVGDECYAQSGNWIAIDTGTYTFRLGKYLGDSDTSHIDDSGSVGGAGLRPVLLMDRNPGVIRHGQAKANWKKQTAGAGNYPSNTGGIGYVEVDRVIGEADTATEFRVYIPVPAPYDGLGGDTRGDGDPNVTEDQHVSFVEVPSKEDPLDSSLPYYEVVGDGYVSRPIGTVEMFFSDSTSPLVPNGWYLCDGTQDTGKTATGAAVDMTGYFPWGNNSYADTNPGGITITDDEVVATIAGHTLTTGDVDDNADGVQETVLSLVDGSSVAAPHVASGTDITITEASSRPKSRGVWFRERYDNAAN
jgi:hypothetical protein